MLVEPLLEQVIPVYNKTIQVNSLTDILAVEKDNNTTEKVFKLYKYFNRIDLSKCVCWLLIERADGSSYNIPVQTSVEDDFIYIRWLVTRTDCAFPGTTLVSIKMGESEQDLLWQTIPAKFRVVDQINQEGLIDPVQPNILDATIIEANKIKEETQEILNSADEVMKEAAQKYMPTWKTF